MKKILKIVSVAAIAMLVVFGMVYASNYWIARQPSQEVFDKVVRNIWEGRYGANNYAGYTNSNNRVCLSLSTYPAPDARSKAQMPMAWYLDFLTDIELNSQREKQISQLNALVKVGLLNKSEVNSIIKGELKPVVRYSLSDKGWAANGQNRNSTCFAYGKLSFFGVDTFTPKIVSGKAGMEMYEVHAKTGVSLNDVFAPWALDPDIQSNFPEIRKQLEGQDFAVMIVRGGGEWVDYSSLLREEALKKSNSPVRQNSVLDKLVFNVKRNFAEMSLQAPPTVDEVKKLLEASHGVGQQTTGPMSCLELPGSEKLPVDQTLFGRDPQHYSVAIYSNKERTAYDRIANKTIPYINMLEQLGILKKHFATGIIGKGKDNDAKFDGYIYELTPEYAGRIHSFYTTCFPLGAPSVEFVDVQISGLSPERMPDSSYRYQLKVLYKNPPLWMNDPVLQSKWPELANVLSRGIACQGEFLFDRKTRQQNSGAGSCWWAFDSYYENY